MTTTAPLASAALTHLAPIALDELVERAALLTRVDRKYLLPTTALPRVLAALAGDTRVLQIDDARDFSYESVYFDTPQLHGYHGAAHRRRRRFKVRIRRYLDTGASFCEVKTRGQRNATVKQRIPYLGDGTALDAEARAHTDAALAEARIALGPVSFAPVLTTHYRRTTLFLPSSGCRVTLDTDLAWALPDGTTLQLPHRVVLETKSAGAASDVDRLLWSLKHRPCSLSKYGTGLAALRPELPSHRWHPVLRRHFSPTESWFQ